MHQLGTVPFSIGLVLLAVQGLLSVQVCIASHSFSSVDYLDMPTESQLIMEPFHGNVRKVLLRLVKAEPDFIKTTIWKFALGRPELTRVSSSLEEVEIFRSLNDLLTEPTKAKHCSSDLVKVYLSALVQARPESVLHGLHSFLQSAGRQKFMRCARIVNNEFRQQTKQQSQQLGKIFETIFAAALNMRKGYTSDDLLDKLSDFDLMYDPFNSQRMLKATIELTTWLERITMIHHDAISLLDQFIQRKCKLLYQDASRELDIIGLARDQYFKSWNYDRNLLLLGEYRRICIAWGNPGKHEEIMARFKR